MGVGFWAALAFGFGGLPVSLASAICFRFISVAPVRGGTPFSLLLQRKGGKRKQLTPSRPAQGQRPRREGASRMPAQAANYTAFADASESGKSHHIAERRIKKRPPQRVASGRQKKPYLALANATAVSSMRFEKPHSLSYQLDTFTNRPDTFVSVASNVDEAGLWLKSIDTSGAEL
jgi:hypothetical protein